MKTNGFEIKIDEKDSIVIINVVWKVSKQDFDNAKKDVNKLIEKTGKINWIILHLVDAPKWESFSAYLAHFTFVKEMHREVPYVAFVTDSMIWEIWEHLGNHFVKATVKHFKYDELEKAKAWILSDEDKKLK